MKYRLTGCQLKAEQFEKLQFFNDKIGQNTNGHFCINITNYRFLTTETNLKALYIFHYFNTTSSVKLFAVTAKIFVYKFLFTIVFLGKRNTINHENFHNLKMKTHFKKEPHFEN